ncbi:hypothetical protein WH50_07140 [Pokkaliibacter plantistimulans]|uniref:NAD-dependent epimerase/dehydratase domain-containing protein n=1 Tax=Pokkaliibacter plantistimulans TaxID=1635171 RepID=A0ABX5M2L1_9GAMM|nr:NAD-dependent epimerase/dehydratase family protein [Pokkaliibacter plantistimulans]PXF31973.1 hypothetical protein WH50_07140 [Pokkaliibacter plantistimulans]
MTIEINCNKVCVIGANGFIGSSIADSLEKRGIDWVGVTRSEPNRDNCIKLDIKDTQGLAEIFSQYPVVINAIGSLKPKSFIDDFEGSMQRAWHTLHDIENSISQSTAKAFVHISSAGTVYGENLGHPSKETDTNQPVSWYGRTKLVEELYFKEACNRQGIRFICARVSNPFGNKRYSEHGFIDVLVNSILNSKSFYIYSHPEYYRDFIHVDDMASAIVELSMSDTSGIYNIASGVSHSLNEIVQYVLKKGIEIDLHHISPNSQDVIKNHICIEKAYKYLPKSMKSLFEYLDEKLA